MKAIQVSRVIELTERRVMETEMNLKKAEAADQLVGTDYKPPVLHEGFAVPKELKEFIDKFVTTYKHYRVGVSNGLKVRWLHGIDVHEFQEVWLYVPGERFARGRIGYGSFLVDKDNANVYMVAHHAIRNQKYRPNRDQYYMQMSTKLDVALKHLYKNMKPYTVAEVAEVERTEFGWKLNSAYSQKQQDANSIVNQKLSKNLLHELITAYKSGYRFTSEDFTRHLEEYIEKRDILKEFENGNRKSIFVSFNDRNGETYVDIVECADPRESGMVKPNNYSNARTVKLSELPVDISGKVAVLSMLDDYGYVEGVGMKVDAQAFWVEGL